MRCRREGWGGGGGGDAEQQVQRRRLNTMWQHTTAVGSRA
jgi:hypothetical protein